VFLTTSRFSREAQDAAFRKGAVSVLLLDGEAIVTQMIERGIGVRREPVVLYDLEPGFFEFDQD
jgi:restriction system protein